MTLPRVRWERLQRQLACFSRGRWEKNATLADTGPRVSAPFGGPFEEPGMHWLWALTNASGGAPGGSAAAGEEACAPLPRWSRRDFCRLLRGRGVLLVGDSLNRALHVTLADLAGTPPALRGRARGYGEDALRRKGVGRLCSGNGVNKPCPGHAVCAGAGAAPLRYRRSDHLRTDVESFRRNERANVVEEPWLGAATSGAYGIIILNRGAHATEDDPFLEGWRGALRALRAGAPRALLLARNTPPGHARCWEASVAALPLASPQPAAGLPYGWSAFARQNRLLERLIAEEFPGVLYLDVATPTALRPDMHRLGSAGRDCLCVLTGVCVLGGREGGGGALCSSVHAPSPPLHPHTLPPQALPGWRWAHGSLGAPRLCSAAPRR